MRSLPAFAILALSGLALSACARGEGAYPSLARRPAERITATWPPAPPPPEPAPPSLDPGTLGQLDSLVAAARSADARFQGKQDRTRSTVAAAGKAAMGSEVWNTASIAVAELESARAEAMISMGELDRLFADARTEGRDVAPIEAARQQVMALIRAEDQTLDSLKGRLDR